MIIGKENLDLRDVNLEVLKEIGYDMLKLRKDLRNEFDEKYKKSIQEWYETSSDGLGPDPEAYPQYLEVVKKSKLKLYNFINSHVPGKLRWLPQEATEDVFREYSNRDIHNNTLRELINELPCKNGKIVGSSLIPRAQKLKDAGFTDKLLKLIRDGYVQKYSEQKFDSDNIKDILHYAFEGYELSLLASIKEDEELETRLKELAEKYPLESVFKPVIKKDNIISSIVEDMKNIGYVYYQEFLSVIVPTALRYVLATATPDIMGSPEIDAYDLLQRSSRFATGLKIATIQRTKIANKMSIILEDPTEYFNKNFHEEYDEETKDIITKILVRAAEVKLELLKNDNILSTLRSCNGMLPLHALEYLETGHQPDHFEVTWR